MTSPTSATGRTSGAGTADPVVQALAAATTAVRAAGAGYGPGADPQTTADRVDALDDLVDALTALPALLRRDLLTNVQRT